MKPDERYTWRACADGYTDTGLRKGITEGDAICQLADYEDTGLSPEEVKLFMRGTLNPHEKQAEIHRDLYVGGTYRHFKGFIAKVLTVAIHSETQELLVVYECTGKGDCDHADGIYARPIEMFLSEVDREKYPDVKQKYRFELITDNPELLETAAKPAAKNIAQSGLAPATENFELMEG